MQKYQNLLWRIESECEKWNPEKRFDFDLGEIIEKNAFYQNAKSKYLDGFWIEKNLGNNSFVFEKGKKLFVPALQFLESQVVRYELRVVSDKNKIVFRDFDESGNLIKSIGLEKFILTQGKKTGLPIYVVDNHNWAFYCWMEFLKIINLEFKIKNGYKNIRQEIHRETLRFKSKTLNQYLKSFLRGLGGVLANKVQDFGQVRIREVSPYFLVHIDAHKDEGCYFLNKNFEQLNLSEIKEITKKLKVSNYISAAIQTGLIQPKFLSITESQDFLNFEKKFKLLKTESQNIILNVDIDFFDPELSLISLEDKVRLIDYFASKADLITFATSPGFIDQELRIEIVKVFLKYL